MVNSGDRDKQNRKFLDDAWRHFLSETIQHLPSGVGEGDHPIDTDQRGYKVRSESTTYLSS